MTGSVGQKRVPRSFIEATEIPLPPLAEQKRIVAKVEELLVRVNAARDRLARVPAILKRFRQAVLAAACSGRLTADWREGNTPSESGAVLSNKLRRFHEKSGFAHKGNAAEPTDGVHNLSRDELPEQWAIEELLWLCEPGRSITYGILKPGPDVKDGIPYVRVADFPNDRLDPSRVRRTSHKIARDYRRSTLRPGDVLLSIRGTVGRVCRVPRELDGANITQDTARLSIQSEMSPEFVVLCLRSPSAKKRFEGAMKGVAVRGINIGDVRALQVPIPPIEEQREIVRRVEALFKLADAIERRVAAATARADKLTQAILAKAFRGELVPTEAELARRESRPYEPAAALLSRIRSQREVP